MSSEKDITLRMPEEVETVPASLEPTQSTVAGDARASGTVKWQAGLGNSLLAAAAANPSPNGSSKFRIPFTSNSSLAHTLIQLKPDDESASTDTSTPSGPSTTNTPATNLIVDDNAETVGPNQMKKSQFLAELKVAVCNTAAQALAGTPLSAVGCPYIERWFTHYAGQSSDYVERAVRRYVPETAGSATAGAYIAAITARVNRAAASWATTGQLTGIPPGVTIPPELLMGAVAGAASTALSGIGNAASSIGSGLASAASGLSSGFGNALSGVTSLLFKEHEGGAHPVGEPDAIQSQLGTGQTLDAGVKTKMESAFGQNFTDVQVHSDTTAASLSESQNARAFTVGQHIAFGAGEYQPGTLVGDALIAHELAHVMQQRGAGPSNGVLQKGSEDYGSLEEDADKIAVAAVVSSIGGPFSGLAKVSGNVFPRLRSGLRLQRCGCSRSSGTSTALLSNQQAQDAITHNSGLGYDADTIRSIQNLVSATANGTFDAATVEKIAAWQTSKSLTANGKIDAATLQSLIQALVAATKYDEAIHAIVDAFNFPTTNLASISYDATVTHADADTSGNIATGAPQTVRVGPSTFAANYAHMIRIIGHELQHVQQRTGATPIVNQNVREFLSYAWEALDTSAPPLTAPERVSHANLAITRYNTFSAPEKTTYNAMYTRLQTLITNGGVGNP